MILDSVPGGVLLLAIVLIALVATMAVVGWAIIPILFRVVLIGL